MRTVVALALMTTLAAGTARASVWDEHALTPDRLPLDPTRSVVVWVHGYDPVSGDFDPLARELRRRGHQVVRFRYDWRQRMDRSADELVAALKALRREHRLSRLRVIAHSQGGLIARRAMTVGRARTLAGDGPIDLVTVASQFPGYRSANMTYLMPRVNWFGVQPSHRDLRSWSPFVRAPGRLADDVRHVKVETLEEGKTRREAGRRVDDCSAPRQAHRPVDRDPRLVDRVALDLGHVGVLRDDAGRARPELLRVLDAWWPVTPGLTGALPR
ncbi:MAG: hypothetical protein M9894_35000 [Planctomycetes bacterium]|nr:hypothetical protein [Planctomycetota bacterium]